MIRVTDRIAIDERQLEWRFLRASGPGGQNVNKVSTAVQLRFDVASSDTLPPEIKLRLARLAGARLTADGWLVIEAQRFRSQSRNREDALHRLLELIRRAAARPKPRIATRPTASSRDRRLAVKKLHATKKLLRRPFREVD
ncbi:MAG TPA: alternative ribosome rescue aminoacyl-tRNA hydrolase ArfB [Burkholderiales bacterium]|nr:alternative ribosome rescue aminoacyl-tRNA hydrolase ArfB [Burkholderiales bacterium]